MRPRPQEVDEPVDERHLRDDGSDPIVLSGELEYVATAEGASPQRDARGVDAVEAASVGDRGTPIGKLAANVEEAQRLTLAGAEVAVVEDERGEPGGGKALGVGVETLLAHSRPSVREHHARVRPLRSIEPRGTARAVRVEGHIGALY